jgi:thiamine kinase-like enzyme
MERIINEIEKVYDIKISYYKPAPRGFCAESYYINSNKGDFFIKIYTNQRFIENVTSSIETQYVISNIIDYIPKPVKNINNEFVSITDASALTLYDYIDGKEYTVKNSIELVSLMAAIYKTGISCKKEEGYIIPVEKQLDAILHGDIEISKELKKFLELKLDFIVQKWEVFKGQCREMAGDHKDVYLTHGDIPGNLMINKSSKIFIIDWDEIMMSPIERDFWFFMDNKKFIHDMEKVLHKKEIGWEYNKGYYDYYLNKRFFEDLYDCIELDLLGKEKPEKIASFLMNIENFLIDSVAEEAAAVCQADDWPFAEQ